MSSLAPAAEYLRFVVTLTAVLDPFFAVPIFLGMTVSRTEPERRALANVVTFTVAAVLVGAALFGAALLRWTGTGLPAFRVGGGLVLLLMALAMLNAQAGGVRQSRDEAEELEAGVQAGVVPLAVPLLAGPGAIGMTIIAAQSGGALHHAAIVGCILAVTAFLWLMLRLARAIGPRLGRTGLNVATRLLGLLLVAIAIQTLAEGLKELFPVLAAG